MDGSMIISIEQAVPALAEVRFAEPVRWTVRRGEQWAVVGTNGSGKNILVDILQGRYLLKEGRVGHGLKGKLYDGVKSISFKDIHSLADMRNAYYQQRWHATETDDLPAVGELFPFAAASTPAGKMICETFCIEEYLPKKIIHLSSGELRKFLIVRTLLSAPEILVLDSPYIGLDAASRKTLTETLEWIARLNRTQVVLLLSDPADIPATVTHVLPVANRRCLEPRTRDTFLADTALLDELFPAHLVPAQLPADAEKVSAHKVIFRMENVTVRYGRRIILENVNWEVRNGEKWALSGPNGSGKTLLLSMICADNPQSYAQTLYLFDRRRGTGESIWDIKRRTGYVSPEMHLYYMENVSAHDIVCSGFFDSIGLFRKCGSAQKIIALEWMEIFGISHLRERPFLTLSSGEQRLALLARAFVKNPDLLVLDEPLHGLDISNRKRVSQIISAFCARKAKTLVYVTHYRHELPPCITHHFTLGESV
ncbi:MAG: ATP-binding cassette domain-containing protein [Tannerella sp.]|jgi:molybdate transport system ATP-binding protein|nr:ATP-binding cassette domain-containing protein [Tannerella sp.]